MGICRFALMGFLVLILIACGKGTEPEDESVSNQSTDSIVIVSNESSFNILAVRFERLDEYNRVTKSDYIDSVISQGSSRSYTVQPGRYNVEVQYENGMWNTHRMLLFERGKTYTVRANLSVTG